MSGEEIDSRALVERSAGRRLALLASSFERLVGRPLVVAGDDQAAALWSAPQVILAHGLEPDPLFFYGNRMALGLFETSAAAFVGMPSRLSAEPLERDERARLLARVSSRGFIDDYSGVRISAAGRRFRIEAAVVWNLMDAQGALHGQAAAFARWTPVDQAR